MSQMITYLRILPDGSVI